MSSSKYFINIQSNNTNFKDYNSYNDDRRNRNRDSYSSYRGRGRERGESTNQPNDQGKKRTYDSTYLSNRSNYGYQDQNQSYQHQNNGNGNVNSPNPNQYGQQYGQQHQQQNQYGNQYGQQYGSNYTNQYGDQPYGNQYGNQQFGQSDNQYGNYRNYGNQNGNYGLQRSQDENQYRSQYNQQGNQSNYGSHSNYNQPNYSQYQNQSHYQTRPNDQYGNRNFKNRPNDKRRGRNGTERYQNYQSTEEPEQPTKPEIIENPQEALEECQTDLAKFEGIKSLEEISGVDSKWGKKPAGFEKVSSQRAKLSGLFPLPGYPRPIDFTKLEGIMKGKTSDGHDILVDTSKIDPNDSSVAKTVIVTGIDFDKVDYLEVTESINNYLRQLDVSEVQQDNIESKLKTRDNRSLILQFQNNICATLSLTLDEKTIKINGEEIVISVNRPKEYIAQGYIVEGEEASDSIVPDCAFKVIFFFGTEFEEDQLKQAIESELKIKLHQFIKDRYSKQLAGFGYVNFDVSNQDIQSAVSNIHRSINKIVDSSPMFTDAKFACITPNTTSIQERQSDETSLLNFVKNQNISVAIAKDEEVIVERDNKRLTVIQIINAVTSKDLTDDENYNFICDDIEEEAKKFGEVIRVKIPRPANDFTPGLTQFSAPGLGRIFVEFSSEDSAFNAILGLSGRFYNDRRVICSFYDGDDFSKTILLAK